MQSRKHKQRVAWSGGLSEDEWQRPGALLLSALFARANERGHQLGEMSQELGVTYGYINQLRNGDRQIPHVSDKFVTAAALYLNVPRMTVLMMAGKVLPTDVYENPTEVVNSIDASIRYIQKDPNWAPLVPHDVTEASYEVKFLIVSLYEKAEDLRLLKGRHSRESIAKHVEQCQAYRAGLRAAQSQVTRAAYSREAST